MTTIIAKIQAAAYRATEQQVEDMARERFTASANVDVLSDCYFKVLLAESQAQLPPLAPSGRKQAISAEAHLMVVEAVHARYYPAVLRGINTPDVAADAPGIDQEEKSRRAKVRNARSNYARSSKSELCSYIEAGNDIRLLVVGDTSKEKLRLARKPPLPENREERITTQAADSILRSVERIAKTSAKDARNVLETAVSKLMKRLNEMGPAVPPRQRRVAKKMARATRKQENGNAVSNLAH